MIGLGEFAELWACDFEFESRSGERPDPICMVARELKSGRTTRLWRDELKRRACAPFATTAGALFIAYYAVAELACFLALGWPLPMRVLDLCVEFRNLTNGVSLPCGANLLGALAFYRLPALDAVSKETMRALALRGEPFNDEERRALVRYCESDVESLGALMDVMSAAIDVPRALLRGRYMRALARIEHEGTPLDTGALRLLRENWGLIKTELVEQIDKSFGVFDRTTFKAQGFANYLARMGITWPMHPSGALMLDQRTFKEMSRLHPQLEPLRELRHALSEMRLEDLAVGSDGRNRCMLSAFRSKTGRNQPSNTRFIFGPAVWLRGLIQPPPGLGIAYIDWEQQEFGIAAALSRDEVMMEAYRSGDAYLAFAKQAAEAPPDATKASHGEIRERFKVVSLGVLYGMGAASLAMKLGISVAHAREIVGLHRRLYHRFWAWSDAAVDYALLHGAISTVFGWTLQVGAAVTTRTLRNFPVQANGAEMLRLACCMATEAGVEVCAPVHDALLIKARLDRIDVIVEQTKRIMEDASALVLGGFGLRSEAKIFRHPDRYADRRGRKMWETVWKLVGEAALPDKATCSAMTQDPRTGDHPLNLLSLSSSGEMARGI